MKKIILITTFAVLLGNQLVSAQSLGSQNSKTVDYVWATQTTVGKQHSAVLDKMQQETEELMLAITPAPLVSLARLIDQKLQDGRNNKAVRKAKKENSTCKL
ncbi:MAG: hypothetical protein IPO83_03210 [Chitinophagaceae bacterium]|nr:hypothetical protein [Chitinophagaceae bacterium]